MADDLTIPEFVYYASAAEYIRLARIPESRRTERQSERFARLDAPIEDPEEEPDGR